MSPISAFLVENLIAVYFFYGLAFFVMGLILTLTVRRKSVFKLAWAIPALALFGIVHGSHEWFEMFQQIGVLSGHVSSLVEEAVRLALLAISFLMLLIFGALLLSPPNGGFWRKYGVVLVLVGVWVVAMLVVAVTFRPSPDQLLPLADVLTRYSLGIPAALLGTWALMRQQRSFRERDMPQFGRDLVWSAAALFLYGAVGQLFVRQTVLVPSTVINNVLFFEWFGIPVQLFRGVMAVVLTIFVVRALRAFELENQRTLEAANRARLQAQNTALEAQRKLSQEMEKLNEELRLKARELSLLLDLSNLLVVPMSLPNRLASVLKRIVFSLEFSESGMILLVGRETETLSVSASIGFDDTNSPNGSKSQRAFALDLAEQCVVRGIAMCRHEDGEVIEFLVEEALEKQRCRQYDSPAVMISLPLTVQQRIIGSIVLARPETEGMYLAFDELKLMVGIAQQLGLSIENARLSQEALKREKMLGDLLHQVVGAQEAERQRIARELHDVTGQSLTAIALGLRGLEAVLDDGSPVEVEQIRELKSFGTNALAELRQIIADLRPPQLDDLGLVAALQWYVQSFEQRYSIQTSFVVEGERIRLSSEYETVLFRITQEALTNVVRHANASQVAVKLDLSLTHICLKIDDDGCGFDPAVVFGDEGRRVGWGLLGIRERSLLLGGQYDINSTPGGGTHLQVDVPLIGEASDAEDKTSTG
jgi:signal transduction histidine kinase